MEAAVWIIISVLFLLVSYKFIAPAAPLKQKTPNKIEEKRFRSRRKSFHSNFHIIVSGRAPGRRQ